MKIDDVYRRLQQFFEISDLGKAHYFLGMEIVHENGMYSISLCSYIAQTIRKFELGEAKPYTDGYRVSSRFGNKSAAAGWAILSKRGPSVHRCNSSTRYSKHRWDPWQESESDWTAAKRILRYLKGTQDRRLELGQPREAGNILVAYSGADWAGDVSSRKSATGCVIFNSSGAIGWISRKQNSVTLSSMEAEYCALSETCQELLWIRRLPKDFNEEQQQPTLVFEDNQSCLSFVSSDRMSKRSKHIESREHFVRDLCNRREIRLEYCPTDSMVVDIFTKPFAAIKHHRFSGML